MSEPFDEALIFGAIAAVTVLAIQLLADWLERREYLARAREDAAHDREMQRQGKTRHCDGWAVWWE